MDLLDFSRLFFNDKEVVIPGKGKMTCSEIFSQRKTCLQYSAKDPNLNSKCEAISKISQDCYYLSDYDFHLKYKYEMEKNEKLIDDLLQQGSQIPNKLVKSNEQELHWILLMSKERLVQKIQEFQQKVL